MRRGVKTAFVGGVFVLVAGGVGFAGYEMLGGDSDGAGLGGADAAPLNASGSGEVTAEEVERTSRDFLAAWARGDADAAGTLTDDPAAAAEALRGFRETGHVENAVVTPGAASGATVPYTVKATISFEGHEKELAYASELTVVRGKSSGRALVDWRPAVLHPKLIEGATLRTGEAKRGSIQALDREGRELTAEKYPSLAPVLDTLRTRYADGAAGEPGVETWIEPADADAPNRTLLTLAKGKTKKVQTTLDADVQAAAERAVKKYDRASVVAVRPSTGEISAVANSPAGGFNVAMEGAQAPGSTMKVVTAAMMLEHGLVGGPTSPVECPKEVTWSGTTFHNNKNFSIANGTFRDSFRRSCNTFFMKALGPLNAKGVEDTALSQTARKYFGLGGVWSIGIVSTDAGIPVSKGPETAASYIGQGKVTMNALSVASLSATVKNGAFRQPVIVPRAMIKGELTTAQPLPGNMAATLRSVMGAAATDGTAAKAMSAVSGDKGAKTGSAEVDGQSDSNSWFTGYADDLAAGSVVQSGGYGSGPAGDVVASVLNAR
ncbi:penicillin-binding transpeptidase domain-containing protein [Streptomyces sp. AP-93]|uniref:penicillin-binding transpeptidase domain-containing protein n=1 Tax=Streptomyces sp. AP-93 TaxID=2929048 RepID=UPI001FAF508C|nr:penicillin-binding transpeptidase domain-containing protein [Streptomyces sp. AP-93]MCJ0873114.1 penicillin-binding protein [Streptomyces sp. AP-93]